MIARYLYLQYLLDYYLSTSAQVRCGRMSRASTWHRKDHCGGGSGSESSYEVTSSDSPDLVVKSSPGDTRDTGHVTRDTWCAGSEYQIQAIFPGPGSSATLPRHLSRYDTRDTCDAWQCYT